MIKKLSIIIPMYNVAQYLEKCIGSVYNQGLTEGEFEVILVDDESPDNSLAVAKSLTKDKNNVQIISQKNKGLGGARNTGMLQATGTYLLFLDSDDWYLPETVEELLQKAIQFDLDIVEFGAQGIDVGGKIIYTSSISSNNISLNGIEYYQKYHYMDSACNKLYCRDFLLKNELTFVERLFIEDYEFNTRAFYKAKKVMALDLIVAQFLQTPNSITRNFERKKQDKMLEDIIIVIKKINEQYRDEKNNYNSTSLSYYQQRLSFLTATLFYQLLKNKYSYKNIKEIKRRLQKENILFVKFPIYDMRKNLFRFFLLNNFFLFRIVLKLI